MEFVPWLTGRLCWCELNAHPVTAVDCTGSEPSIDCVTVKYSNHQAMAASIYINLLSDEIYLLSYL